VTQVKPDTIVKQKLFKVYNKRVQINSNRPIAIALEALINNPLALIGVFGFLFLTVLSLLAPYIAPYDPNTIDSTILLQAPNREHLFGTDDLGRDVFTRVIYGGRESLKTSYIAVLIGMSGGILIGLISGYFGGWIDTIIQRLIEILIAFPNILFTISIVAILGPGLTSVMLAIGLGRIPGYSRMIRGSVMDANTNDYILSARVVGAKNRRVMFKHVLPNVIGPILIYATLGLGSAIAIGAGLSYIGLGAQPPSPEWGAMLNYGRNYMRSAAWMSFWPGLMIAISVLSVNLFGDALRDALDPKTR
jgi:peptide/nickel transport system permease protein